jgi:hypothetical protein
MTTLDFFLRVWNAAALALAGALLTALPTQARLHDRDVSGGYFMGLPVRAEAPASRPNEAELTGVAGRCYLLRQVVRDRSGASFLHSVRVCE